MKAEGLRRGQGDGAGGDGGRYGGSVNDFILDGLLGLPISAFPRPPISLSPLPSSFILPPSLSGPVSLNKEWRTLRPDVGQNPCPALRA
jgi:hypothetical protein